MIVTVPGVVPAVNVAVYVPSPLSVTELTEPRDGVPKVRVRVFALRSTPSTSLSWTVSVTAEDPSAGMDVVLEVSVLCTRLAGEHVAQMGSGRVHEVALDEKSVGSDAMFVTHQALRSRLNTLAPENIAFMLVTLLTSHLPMS